MKLQLINSPIDKQYSKSLRTGVYPPLNLAVIAGFLKKVRPKTEIELFDGEIEDIDSIKKKLTSGFVGISTNILTYNSAIELAAFAKLKGATVILGGPYPTVLAKQILLKNKFVDYIVKGDGEKALLGLINNNKLDEIPNLVYRKKDNIVNTNSSNTNIDELVVPNYLNLPLNEYFRNFSKRYGNYKPFNGSLPIYSIKGCKWRNNSKGGCLFCVIPNKGVRIKQHENLINEILYFNEIYGINSFWEVSDSLLDDFALFEKLKALKKVNDKISYHIYGRANQLQNISKVKDLKEANVFEVFIGAESGDNDILKKINKGCTVEQSLKAIENLNFYGIKCTVSFVLGLPGENSNTLLNTLRFAEKLSKYENVFETSTSIMLPIPGSQAFEMLRQKTGLIESDKYDLEYLKNLWISELTNVDIETVQSYLDKITSLFSLNNTFAQPELLTAPYC